jgi:hypothetical protein
LRLSKRQKAGLVPSSPAQKDRMGEYWAHFSYKDRRISGTNCKNYGWYWRQSPATPLHLHLSLRAGSAMRADRNEYFAVISARD